MKNKYNANSGFIINIIMIILFIAFVWLFAGCKAKVVSTNKAVHDTIIVNKTLKYTQPTLTQLTLNSLCDTLGNLRPFLYNSSSGSVKIKIESKNDTVFISHNVDSIKQSAIDTYKSHAESEDITQEKPVYPKLFWWSLGLNILVILYIIIKIKGWFSFFPV